MPAQLAKLMVSLRTTLWSKSISKSLPNEVVILKKLTKQKIMASNRLANEVGKFSNLPTPASAHAYMRARICCASVHASPSMRRRSHCTVAVPCRVMARTTNLSLLLLADKAGVKASRPRELISAIDDNALLP
jgi:hypothetical protein